MIKIGTVVFLIGLLSVLSVAARAQNDSPALDAIKSNLLAGKVFKAKLDNKFIDPTTKDTVHTSGEIWIGKNEYKIHMNDRYIVVDGKVSRVYSAQKNQLIISNYDPSEDDYAPSHFLAGTQKEYMVRQQKSPNGNYHVVLFSRDPFSLFKQVDIMVDKKNDTPLWVKSVDQTGNITISRFDDGVYVMGTAEMFDLKYPSNAHIVDLRKE